LVVARCDACELPVPAQGGRFVELPGREVFMPPFVERFAELPNPCGARPESVVLPCALQERPLFAEVEREELYVEFSPREPGCVAYDGRLDCSSDCRLELSPLAFDVECATAEVAPRFANELEVFMV
jgi:hypothetical protein